MLPRYSGEIKNTSPQGERRETSWIIVGLQHKAKYISEPHVQRCFIERAADDHPLDAAPALLTWPLLQPSAAAWVGGSAL